MTPRAFYRRLNRLIWMNRLPDAKIVVVDDKILPNCYGITLQDRDFISPVIFLNLSGRNHWMRTMVHECIHVAEPELAHGFIFEALVETYYRRARKNIKSLNIRRGKPRFKDEGTIGTHDYMTHVSDAASFEAYKRQEPDPLLSVEALPETGSIINFKAFATEYPEKLFPLVAQLRPEFQEFFIEFHILRKSQAFIGKCHGQIQTRVWQVLRLIEQAIGSMIILGTNPTAEVIRPILRKAGVEYAAFGSLTDMILCYAASQSYAVVAEKFRIPVPAVRKIFRPAITALLANKDVKAVAVGAYLRSLTHQASLTGAGLSKRCKARNRRVKTLRFVAPPSNNSPLLSFGHSDALGDTPWNMLEISSDQRMAQIKPALHPQGKKVFGKKAGQIFAPVNADGELEFGYIFARSGTPALVRKLLHIRGIAELATMCDGEGNFVKAVTISNDDVQTMIKKHNPPTNSGFRVGQFVEILTGDAKGYCGTITKEDKNGFIVQVNFPTGRCFLVRADETSLKSLSRVQVAGAKRMFWGVLGS